MAELTALDPKAHGKLYVARDNFSIFAKDKHLLAIKVTEVPRAIIDLPVLISRHQHDGSFALSAMTSFVAGKNLYMDSDQWTSSFRSTAMLSYPLFLMRNPDGSDDPILGVDMDSNALAKTDGQSLFNSKGKPSLWQEEQRKRLLEDARNSIITQQYLRTINDMGLLREVAINVHFADEQVNQITGLFMINEDALQALPSEKLTDLRDVGYLPAIYAMLFSVFQLNSLILRHNRAGLSPISRISLEVAKDHHS